MKEISEEYRSRFYQEVSIHLARAGFTVLPQKGGLLPLEWNGAAATTRDSADDAGGTDCGETVADPAGWRLPYQSEK